MGGSARQGRRNLLFRKVSRLLHKSTRGLPPPSKTEETTRVSAVVSSNLRPCLVPETGGRSRLRHPTSFAKISEIPGRKIRDFEQIHWGFLFSEDGGGGEGISDDTVLFPVVVPPAYQPHVRHPPIPANGVPGSSTPSTSRQKPLVCSLLRRERYAINEEESDTLPDGERLCRASTSLLGHLH